MKFPLLRWFCLAAVFCGMVATSFGNADVRTWVFSTGKSVRAELVSYVEKTHKVLLRSEDRQETEYTDTEFSLLDKAWLLEWTESAEEMEALQAKLGGKLVHLQTTGRYPTDLYVYHPSKEPQNPPIMILFHTGAKPLRYLRKHMEAAEAAQLTLVGCGSFRNTTIDAEEKEQEARFHEILPLIERAVPHDPKRMFMGGTSGAALRAYVYTAKYRRPWAGVYANGGWLGDEEYSTLPFPGGMRIAMVNGDKDYLANDRIDSDGNILVKAGNEVSVMAFDGAHQVPPPSVQTKAFRWLLRQSN